MTSLVNEAVLGMINDGYLSGSKIRRLIEIKELVDRISVKKYLEEEDTRELFHRYGVLPNVVTWGDYFQTELATTLKELSDSAFERVIDTVRYDLISSYIIFSAQSGAFFEWVEANHAVIVPCGEGGHTEEENEILHLKILKDYYVNLGIVNAFTDAELAWHESYVEAAAV
ncbi:MAG: hypothetical protein JXA20_07755 [Spirochaetes bacterium]|nr:hypothetical protein [Spirochaetota bacterium]